MAGKTPNKPTAAKSQVRKPVAPAAILANPMSAPVPALETSVLDSSSSSPVAMAIAASETLAPQVQPVPVRREAPARATVTAPVAASMAAPIAAPVKASAPAAPSLPETLAEAPVAPTPESPVVAVSAPTVIEPAAPAAASSQPVAPESVPAAQEKKEAAMDTVETTVAKTETMFADMNGRAKAAMEKTQQLATEMGDLHKGNLEAVVESAKIYAKGVEAMGQEAAEFSRRSFEQMTAALKSMAQVKTPAELMKLHADYVRSSFDAAVAEGSKNTEAMIKLAGDVAQPMSSRFALVAEKVKTAA